MITDNTKLKIVRSISVIPIVYEIYLIYHQSTSIVYFLPAISFIPSKYWWDKPIVWIIYWIAVGGAVIYGLNNIYKIICAS